MGWKEIAEMSPSDLHDALEAQKIKKISTDQRRTIPSKDGIEIMNAMSYDLFQDRPSLVAEHCTIRKFCHCIPCKEYFEET